MIVLYCKQRWDEEMELEDAIHTALKTLREGFEGEVRLLRVLHPPVCSRWPRPLTACDLTSHSDDVKEH